MHNYPFSSGKLILIWLLAWALLLAWWWGVWTLFNVGSVLAGGLLGIGVPALVTAIAFLGASGRPSLEDDRHA